MDAWQVVNVLIGVLVTVLGFLLKDFHGRFLEHQKMEGHPQLVERVAATNARIEAINEQVSEDLGEIKATVKEIDTVVRRIENGGRHRQGGATP